MAMTVYLTLRSIVTVILLLSSVIYILHYNAKYIIISHFVILAIVKRTMMKYIVCQLHMPKLLYGTGSE